MWPPSLLVSKRIDPPRVLCFWETSSVDLSSTCFFLVGSCRSAWVDCGTWLLPTACSAHATGNSHAAPSLLWQPSEAASPSSGSGSVTEEADKPLGDANCTSIVQLRTTKLKWAPKGFRGIGESTRQLQQQLLQTNRSSNQPSQAD